MGNDGDRSRNQWGMRCVSQFAPPLPNIHVLARGRGGLPCSFPANFNVNPLASEQRRLGQLVDAGMSYSR